MKFKRRKNRNELLKHPVQSKKDLRATILDKTVEKIAYLGAFFLNFVADQFFPPPPPPEAMLLGLLKKAGSLSISRKQL